MGGESGMVGTRDGNADYLQFLEYSFEQHRVSTLRAFTPETASANMNFLGGNMCNYCFSFVGRFEECTCDDTVSTGPSYYGGSSGWNSGDTAYLDLFFVINVLLITMYKFSKITLKWCALVFLLSVTTLCPGLIYFMYSVLCTMAVSFYYHPILSFFFYSSIITIIYYTILAIKRKIISLVSNMLFFVKNPAMMLDLPSYLYGLYNRRPYIVTSIFYFFYAYVPEIDQMLDQRNINYYNNKIPNLFFIVSCIISFFIILNLKTKKHKKIFISIFFIFSVVFFFLKLHYLYEAYNYHFFIYFLKKRSFYYKYFINLTWSFLSIYFKIYEKIQKNYLYNKNIRFNTNPKIRIVQPDVYFFSLKYYDHFKLPNVPEVLKSTPERLAFTLQQMNNLFDTGATLESHDITHEFLYADNDKDDLMNPLKKDTKIRSIFKVYGQKTGTSSYRINPHYEFSKKYEEKMIKYGENPKTLEYYWAGNDPELIKKTINSTSRYGEEEYSFNSFDREEMLEAMKIATSAMFRHSRLTSIRKIMRNFEWKYSAGFGSSDNKKFKKRKYLFTKYTRKEIEEYLRSLINKYDKLASVSHVFPKMEWLSPEKRRKIRSVIGTPFLTYFMQQIFAYEPDHRFEYEKTPFQVGRPLTGYGLAPLFHSFREECDYVYGLDFSAFDSTFNKEVMDIVSDLRCWGYEGHAQEKEIRNLIKLSYEMNYKDPLFIGSIAELFQKNRGNTTGAVSTSQTNCCALQLFKLQLFHEVTGLPYRDFFKYYKLANYGDDNLLGILKNIDRPLEEVKGWVNQMVQICKVNYQGTINLKIEEEGQITDTAFLSKRAFDLEEHEKEILNQAGLHPKIGVAHDYEKLKGKFDKFKKDAKKLTTTDYVQKFAAFKLLSAHHRNFFNVVDELWTDYVNANPNARFNEHYRIANINYEQVLIKHYSVMDKVCKKIMEAEGFFFNGVYDKSHSPYGFKEIFLNKLESLLFFFSSSSVAELARSSDHSAFIKYIMSNPTFQRSAMDYLSSLSYHSGKTYDEGKSYFSGIFKPFSELPTPLHQYTDTKKSCLDVFLNLLIIDALQTKKYFSFLGLYDPISYVYDIFNRINHISTLFFGVLFNNFVPYTFYHNKEQIYNTLLLILISFRSLGKYEGSRFKIPIIDFENEIIRWLNTLRHTVIDLFSGTPVKEQKKERNYDEILDSLDFNTRTLFTAPTGWGKSTSFIVALQKRLDETIYVILPRVVIVEDLYQKMSKWYPEIRFNAWFENSRYRSDNPQIVFTTIQSFMTHDVPKDAFVVIDEAHINEPCYNIFNKDPYPRGLSMTATPTPVLRKLPKKIIKGSTPFTIHEENITCPTLDAYKELVFNATKHCNKKEKTLIFVPTKRMVSDLENRFKLKGIKTCGLHSGKTIIDFDASVFISTCVSDAGLTLPSVTRVFSPDIDIHVSGNRPYFYKINANTIIQRKGRTGRTCNGSFFLYEIFKTKVEPFHQKTSEFVAGALPCLCSSYLRSNLLVKRYEKYLTVFLNMNPMFATKDDVLNAMPNLSHLLLRCGDIETNPGPIQQWLDYLKEKLTPFDYNIYGPNVVRQHQEELKLNFVLIISTFFLSCLTPAFMPVCIHYIIETLSTVFPLFADLKGLVGTLMVRYGKYYLAFLHIYTVFSFTTIFTLFNLSKIYPVINVLLIRHQFIVQGLFFLLSSGIIAATLAVTLDIQLIIIYFLLFLDELYYYFDSFRVVGSNTDSIITILKGFSFYGVYHQEDLEYFQGYYHFYFIHKNGAMLACSTHSSTWVKIIYKCLSNKQLWKMPMPDFKRKTSVVPEISYIIQEEAENKEEDDSFTNINEDLELEYYKQLYNDNKPLPVIQRSRCVSIAHFYNVYCVHCSNDDPILEEDFDKIQDLLDLTNTLTSY